MGMEGGPPPPPALRLAKTDRWSPIVVRFRSEGRAQDSTEEAAKATAAPASARRPTCGAAA